MRHKNYLEVKDSVQVQNALANFTAKFKLFWRWRNRLALLGLCLSATAAFANQLDIVGPPGSGRFGDQVKVLPNGNFMVSDPSFDLSNPTVVGVGALYVYAPDGEMISQLAGSKTNDQVGLDRVQLLTNGNFLVTDPSFDLSNPTVVDVGAVYLYTADGEMISQLTGSNTNDRVGLERVQFLTNGNFILRSYGPNGSCAVTWGSATQGVKGVVSPTNSLIGKGGRISVTVLNNGNYVVLNPT